MKKVTGAFSRFLRPVMKLFVIYFRRILDVLLIQGLQKSFWAQFHDFCVQKRSCLLLSSGAFQKFSACKVYRRSYGRIFTIYASKNEVASCEVQTHFGSLHLARFIKKFWAHHPDVCVQKRSCLPWSSDAFLKFSASRVYGESSVRISGFSRPKAKLFALKFTHILEVLCLQGLHKKVSWHS